MQRRVAITGIGIVCSLGNDRESTWQRILKGESGAALIAAFDARTWPTKFACEVKDFKLAADAAADEALPFLSRPSTFGVQAALDAIRDSGIEGLLDPERFGVAIGASVGGLSPVGVAQVMAGKNKVVMATGEMQSETTSMMRNHPGTLAAVLSARWRALGPVTTIQTACASSGQSVGQAFLQIRRGEADVMLAGGADSLQGEMLLGGFCLLGALSRRNEEPTAASRPFDKDRDGFVAGEGAAMLILEELSHAKARGAKIYGEIAGYGETESAYRITDMPEDGRGINEAMEIAVQDAGLKHADIQYINAHGTSTQLNDRVECFSVRKIFGGRGLHPMMSSTKSEIGHLISAAGGMEAAFCALAIRDNMAPPTRNLFHSDCGQDVDLIAHTARPAQIYATLSNSIGFGGSNSSLLIKRCDG